MSEQTSDEVQRLLQLQEMVDPDRNPLSASFYGFLALTLKQQQDPRWEQITDTPTANAIVIDTTPKCANSYLATQLCRSQMLVLDVSQQQSLVTTTQTTIKHSPRAHVVEAIRQVEWASTPSELAHTASSGTYTAILIYGSNGLLTLDTPDPLQYKQDLLKSLPPDGVLYIIS